MSVVQFNLLPDVKLEYNQAQKTMRLVYLISSLAVGVIMAIFIVSFFIVNVAQAHLLKTEESKMKTNTQKLKDIPDLDKILTIQNQLNSLPGLHDKKHYASRLFEFLPHITPQNVHLGKLKIDTTASTISITGTAPTVKNVNEFVDTIKFTSFTVDGDASTKKPAFSKVILTNVDKNEDGAVYTIDAVFDPGIFTGTQKVALVVPDQITTRSHVNAPDPNGPAPSTSNPIFNGDTGEPDKKGAQ